MDNLKIIFHLDGTGVFLTGIHHLDGILAYQYFANNGCDRLTNANDVPEDADLPLEKWEIDGHWGWKASMLFPGEKFNSSIQYRRRRFNINRIEMLNCSISTMGFTTGNRNMPMDLKLVDKIYSYAVGDKNKLLNLLKNIKYIGMDASRGKGRVNDITIEYLDRDKSMYDSDGHPVRYLPDESGSRFGRVRPPYWNNHDRCHTKIFIQ